MRRGIAIAIAGLIAAGAMSATVLANLDAWAASPSRVLVTADEFTLVLSRAAIVKGDTIIQHYNRGEDPHDLRLRRVGRTRIRKVPTIGPGELASLRLRMGRGRWRMWCSLSNHRELGMVATLKVKKRL